MIFPHHVSAGSAPVVCNPRMPSLITSHRGALKPFIVVTHRRPKPLVLGANPRRNLHIKRTVIPVCRFVSRREMNWWRPPYSLPKATTDPVSVECPPVTIPMARRPQLRTCERTSPYFPGTNPAWPWSLATASRPRFLPARHQAILPSRHILPNSFFGPARLLRGLNPAPTERIIRCDCGKKARAEYIIGSVVSPSLDAKHFNLHSTRSPRVYNSHPWPASATSLIFLRKTRIFFLSIGYYNLGTDLF